MDKNLDIIYEDQAMLVCYKKAGFPVQSARVGVRDLESLVRSYLVKKSAGRSSYAAVINRLDQPVEGIVLFAKNKEAAAHLSEQIRSHAAGKYYMAVVEGAFQKNQGTLENYLKKDGKNHCSKVVDKDEPEAKASKLEYSVVKSVETEQLLEVHLLTGRYHQIRVQLSYAGHPIIGDNRYNPSYQNCKGRIFPALCAYKLVVHHPVSGKKMEFTRQPQGQSFAKYYE